MTAVKASVDHGRADSLLRVWWAASHRWALDGPNVSPEDEALLHDTLHQLAMMAHVTNRPLLNLGMGALLPMSSRAGDGARRVPYVDGEADQPG